MKKILLLGPARHAVSGVSTHLNQLFASHLAERWTLSQFQVGSEGRQENAVKKALRLLLSPLGLFFAILREQPDIVHINTSMNSKSYWRDLAYLAVAKLLGRKVVYQVHGGALPLDFFKTAPLRALLRSVLHLADRTVLLARIEMQAYQAFAPQGRFVLIANAIDAQRKLAIRRELTQGPLRLLYFGRLVLSKGLSESLIALRLLKDEGRKMTLTVAGTGPDTRTFQHETAEWGLSEDVNFVGPVFGDDKLALWKAHDIFVFPTNLTEGLPYALLEAMASGAVPICTAMGGMPDVLQHRKQGYVVPNRDIGAIAQALRTLDDDRALLLQLGQQGQQRIREAYTIDHMADAFEQLYSELSNPASSKPAGTNSPAPSPSPSAFAPNSSPKKSHGH